MTEEPDSPTLQSLIEHARETYRHIQRQDRQMEALAEATRKSNEALSGLISGLSRDQTLLLLVMQRLAGSTAFAKAVAEVTQRLDAIEAAGPDAPIPRSLVDGSEADPANAVLDTPLDTPLDTVLDTPDTPPEPPAPVDPILLETLEIERGERALCPAPRETAYYALHVPALPDDYDEAQLAVWALFRQLVEAAPAALLTTRKRDWLLQLADDMIFDQPYFEYEALGEARGIYVNWVQRALYMGGEYQMGPDEDMFTYLYLWVQIATGTLYTHRLRQAETRMEVQAQLQP